MKDQSIHTENNTAKLPTIRSSRKKIIGVGLLITFIIAQIIFDGIVVWRYVHVVNPAQSDPLVATMLFRSINDLYSPVPTEAKTGDQYESHARLVIPAYNTRDILYAYTPKNGQISASVSFTTRQIISEGENQTIRAYYDSFTKNTYSKDQLGKAFGALFNELPSLQSCARGVQVFEATQTDNNLNNRGTKMLQDGRKLHFYTEEKCTQQDKLNELLDVIKQVNSY